MSDPVTWLDTPAARFRAVGGDEMPTADDFDRADMSEIRIEARRAFDLAYGREPTPGITSESRMKIYRDDLTAIKARGNWITDDDAGIRERIRRMGAYAHAQASADSAEVYGPGTGMNAAQREAYRRAQEANAARDASGPLRGVPHA